jgi:hypothetical protein
MDPYVVLKLQKNCCLEEAMKAADSLLELYNPENNLGNKLVAVKYGQILQAIEAIKREKKEEDEAKKAS